jgi:ferric-dicitrate binding protein FerR (iron transport regulator)
LNVQLEKSQTDDPLPELDEAMGEFAREYSRESASEAMQWATAIQDEELKEKTITRVGQSWMRQDEEAAKEWLPSSGLTEEVQKAIVTPPEEGRRWGGGPPRGPR